MTTTAPDLTVPRGSTWRELGAFVRRDFTTARSYRLPFVLDIGSAALQVSLFFFFASIIDSSGSSFLDTFEGGYFAYVVLGLVVMRTVETTLRSFSSAMRGEQVTGTFESLLTTPAPLRSIALGGAAYSFVYGIVMAILMLGFGFALGLRLDATPMSAASALVAFLACLAAFSGVGIAIAAFVVLFKHGTSVLGLVTQALGLLGGVYFPVALLPSFLQGLSHLVPLTWALEAIRGGLLGATVETADVAAVVALGVLLPAVSGVLLRAALVRARKQGSLSYY